MLLLATSWPSPEHCESETRHGDIDDSNSLRDRRALPVPANHGCRKPAGAARQSWRRNTRRKKVCPRPFTPLPLIPLPLRNMTHQNPPGLASHYSLIFKTPNSGCDSDSGQHCRVGICIEQRLSTTRAQLRHQKIEIHFSLSPV